jgi:hypothetical protein
VCAHQSTGGAIAGARRWTSRDEGASWRPVANLREVGEGRVQAHQPAGRPSDDAAVSLRVEAWDSHGNHIEQEIIRAYATHTAGPPR